MRCGRTCSGNTARPVRLAHEFPPRAVKPCFARALAPPLLEIGGALSVSNRELPMMPWYPDQFAASTRSFSLLERAIYRELLDAQWQADSLPSNEKLLARIVGLDVRVFRKSWVVVREKFITLPNGNLQNARLEKHRLAALDRRQKLIDAGRMGGQASVKHRSSNGASIAQPNAQALLNTLSLSPSEDKNSVLSGEVKPSPSVPPRRSPSPERRLIKTSNPEEIERRRREAAAIAEALAAKAAP